MLVMLPEWDRIALGERGITASTALTQINNVMYCMREQGGETGNHLFYRALHGFDEKQVSIKNNRPVHLHEQAALIRLIRVNTYYFECQDER